MRGLLLDVGAACNGCGLCCSAEPCPLGCWLSRRRHGACAALDWNDAARRYECTAVSRPTRWFPWLPVPLGRRLALRWIAAGAGCDSDYVPTGATAQATKSG